MKLLRSFIGRGPTAHQTINMTVGRPRLPTPERLQRRLESKRAWAARNVEYKQALDKEYRSRPGHNERRRARYVRKTPKPPTDPDERAEHVRALARLRDQRFRGRKKRAASELEEGSEERSQMPVCAA